MLPRVKSIPDKYLFIARDNDGQLHAFTKEPLKEGDTWVGEDKLEVDDVDMYASVKFTEVCARVLLSYYKKGSNYENRD